MQRYWIYSLALFVAVGCSSLSESETFVNAVIEGRDVQEFLGRGVDVELILPDDHTRKTPLLWACTKAHSKHGGDYEAVVAALLDAGADIAAVDAYGNGAVGMAATYGSIEVVALLLDRGADINHQGSSGNTALMGAVRAGELEAVRFLLAQGADLTLRNSNGESALDIAVGRPEIEQLLKGAEAG